MGDDIVPNKPAGLPLKIVVMVLHEPARWRLLRELIKGEALPVGELARRIGMKAPLVSKHMNVLRRAGLAMHTYGQLYRLSPRLKPEADGQRLDLGPCVLKFDALG